MTTPRLTLNFRDFQPALKRVALACSKDAARPVLQTVQVILSPARVRIQAADGFRLHRVDVWDDHGTFEFPAGLKKFRVLLSPAQVKDLIKRKITRKDNPRVTIEPDAGHVIIDDKRTAGTFDTESNFPDVDCLFPKHPALQVKVKSADLLAAVKTAKVINPDTVSVHIHESIVVYARSKETGESWNVTTPEHVNNPKKTRLSLAFNPDFLVDYLKTAGEFVTVDLWTKTSPAVFRDGAGNDYTALIMPKNLDNGLFYTPADIPTPAARPDKIQVEFDLETGEFIPSEDTRKYYEQADAWKLQHTVKHDPQFGNLAYSRGKIIEDDIFVSVPEAGAVEYDLTQAFAYHVEPDNGRGKGIGLIALHLQNPRPDPSAPIAVDWTFPATRHPLFATGKNSKLSVGECNRCADPDHHALYDGLCGACQAEVAELERSHR